MSLMKVTAGQGKYSSKAPQWQTITYERRECVNSCFILTFVVSLSDPIGVKWSDLEKRLNPNYDWNAALSRSLETNTLIQDTIADGSLFVVQYPAFDNLSTVPDITEPSPTRKMWPAMSPIALFVSRPGGKGRPAQLQPVAIQVDSTSGKYEDNLSLLVPSLRILFLPVSCFRSFSSPNSKI